MADQLELKFNDNGFREFLDNVKVSKLRGALRTGMRKSLNIIKKQAVTNLKAIRFKKGGLDTSNAVIFKNSNGKKYIYPAFPKSILVRVAKSGKVGNVAIRKPSDKASNPILTMIQNAKGERFTKGRGQGFIKGNESTRKKTHSTGSIGPHNFFGDAVEQTKARVENELRTNVLNAIEKAKERYLK